jgi:hypothetical protein
MSQQGYGGPPGGQPPYGGGGPGWGQPPGAQGQRQQPQPQQPGMGPTGTAPGQPAPGGWGPTPTQPSMQGGTPPLGWGQPPMQGGAPPPGWGQPPMQGGPPPGWGPPPGVGYAPMPPQPQGLTVGSIMANGFSIGMRNALALLVNVLLWILTVWIPYLNVGTTIGICALAAKMSKGQPISPTEVFNPIYRKRMGEFFLVLAFVGLGVLIGMAFAFIPAYVIGISWMLAPLLVVDKELDPMDAITKSNTYTYGKKWTIFFGFLLLSLTVVVPVGVVLAVMGWVLSRLDSGAGQILGIGIIGLIAMIANVIVMAIQMGALAHVYGELTKSQKA